jgi:hypothetical protein
MGNQNIKEGVHIHIVDAVATLALRIPNTIVFHKSS